MINSVDNEYVPKRLRAEMQVRFGSPDGTLLSGFSIDLSTGGLFLQTNYPLNVDDILILRFKLLRQDDTISCPSKVAWVNTKENPYNPEFAPGVGIQFVDIPLEEVNAIGRFLKHNDIQPSW
ncbi:PilZ domain-containing protein [Geopsychrobacter electrodiphilus]|uniref:PilZ domain-containing protein n=1 Tax=Geopsychrobacter electrodiphilus TaxID=225196 RepID=UPI00036B8101|nr:PilZ domain-containing protein [Geopsychrobacter electrodiphilus]